MCNHSPSSAQTSAIASSSSMAPEFVVPRLATTANIPSVPESASVLRNAAPVMRAALVRGHEHDVDVHHLAEAWTEAWVSAVVANRHRPPVGAPRPFTGLVPCRDQRRQVGGRPAADEAPAGALGKTGQRRQPGEGLVLGGDRPGAAFPQAAEDARRADHQVEEVGRRRRSGGHVGQVHRVVHRPAGVHQHIAEQRQRGVAAEALRRDGALQGDRQLVGRAGAPGGVFGGLQSLDGVADDRLGEEVGALVPAVHLLRRPGDRTSAVGDRGRTRPPP